MNAEQIQATIAQRMPCEHVHVEGDGSHWFATIVSAEFEGERPLQRQRRVNAAMEEFIHSGAVHALSMKTFTPAEWAARQSADK